MLETGKAALYDRDGGGLLQTLLNEIDRQRRASRSPSRTALVAASPTALSLSAWIVLLQDRLDRFGRSVLDVALANPQSSEPLSLLLTSVDPPYLPATAATDPDPGTGATLLHRAALCDSVLAVNLLLGPRTPSLPPRSCRVRLGLLSTFLTSPIMHAQTDRSRSVTTDVNASLYARGPATTAAFAIDAQGRLWIAAAGLENHAKDGVYVFKRVGPK